MSKLFVPRFRREQQQQQQAQADAAASASAQQQQQQPQLSEQEQSDRAQQESWEQTQRSIKAAVNRVTVENIELVADDLFKANVLRGRGIFCSVVAAAQLASPHLSDVFSALVARVNSRLPQVGELLLRRLLHQLWRTLRLKQLEQVKHTCLFLAHLSMARVCGVVVLLKLLALFLCASSNTVSTNRVLIAAAIFTETYKFLDREYPDAFAAVLEPARQLLEEGGEQLDTRSEEALDSVLKLVREHQLNKEKQVGLVKTAAVGAGASASAIGVASMPTSRESKAKNEKQEKEQRNKDFLQQIIDEASAFVPVVPMPTTTSTTTTEQEDEEANTNSSCHEDIDVDLSTPPPEPSMALDKFAALPKAEYAQQQQHYTTVVLPRVLLSADQRKVLEDRISATTAARLGVNSSSTSLVRPREGDDDDEKSSGANNKQQPNLLTAADFNGLADAATAQARKEIFLLFSSSIRAEEIAHKLLGNVAKVQQQQGNAAMQRQQQLIVSMLITTMTRDKSFDPIYATTAELLCRSSGPSGVVYRDNFEEAFRIAYRGAEDYDGRQLNILGQLYAQLLRTGAVTWRPLRVVDLSLDATTSGQRIFMEHLLRELAAGMSVAELADKLHYDDNVTPHVEKMFPTDSQENARYATAFYQMIGLRQLATPMEGVADL